jgi:hypothetical protein
MVLYYPAPAMVAGLFYSSSLMTVAVLGREPINLPDRQRAPESTVPR